MRNVIFCVALGKKNKMYELSIKSIQQYAKKIAADFIVHEKPYFNIDWEVAEQFKTKKIARYAWVEKLYAIELLKSYDRVLLIDTDVLVAPYAPDIFSIYADDTKNYALAETLYDTRLDRDGQKDISRLEQVLGCVDNWPKSAELRRYFNSGVVLLSKKSNIQTYFSLEELKSIFNEIVYIDQTYLNYLFFKYQISVGELDIKYNWMPHLHTKKGRHVAYFIHHSLNGCGISKCLKTETFVNDYCRYYQQPLHYKLNFIFRKMYAVYLLLKHNIKKIFNKI